MSSLKTQPIPVYPVVLKFLQFHYGTGPLVIAYDLNPYSSFLRACLDRYPTRTIPRKYRRLTASLMVGMSHWEARHGFGSNLSPQKILDFNEFVKMSFLDKLVGEVRIRTECGMELNEAVMRILQRYELSEDELPLLTVLRYYYRHQKRHTAQERTIALSRRSVDVIRTGQMVA
ncbi:hypothetical protein F5984_20575 [Rudanella paleaurantiibacter]|uniref:Uncharacterized protein n=1 Tax=Rudanella paleaurantiibacter TaxID=2614655 RepID=A0A7J5TW31_9BACT|nr:hypothetical protein [Rudanella paleaurantiibacter]KAB7728143.1 hypothetical protein F5984_20575 [Rudanella paleaurantiibacter]